MNIEIALASLFKVARGSAFLCGPQLHEESGEELYVFGPNPKLKRSNSLLAASGIRSHRCCCQLLDCCELLEFTGRQCTARLRLRQCALAIPTQESFILLSARLSTCCCMFFLPLSLSLSLSLPLPLSLGVRGRLRHPKFINRVPCFDVEAQQQ